MATSFEHRALVEQLRALTQKRAENPGEQILNTSHPSGSNSAADDHTRPAVVGHRYSENTSDNKAMYPAGTDSDTKLEAGSQQKDPGHNKGLHPRPSGEAPEVERKYNLNEHNDPGSSHPSGKAAQEFISEAKTLAAELRNLIKASASGSGADTYVTGNPPEEATNSNDANAKGTEAYPQNEENDGNIALSKEQGKDAAAGLADIRARATAEYVETCNSLKASAALDAESFIQTITAVMDKFAAPHVLPAIEQHQKAAAVAQIDDLASKIAMYDLLAEADSMPKFAEMMEGKKKDNKKPDADGDGVPDWADKKEGPDAEKKEAAKLATLLKKVAEMYVSEDASNDDSDDSSEKSKDKPKPANTQEKKEASRKGGTFRKRSEEEEEMMEDEEGEDSPSEEEVSDDEEAAAEEVLANMASMPSGGGAPDEMAKMMDPGAMAEGAEQAPLSPEEEAALMALMQQEGMKESDVKAFATTSALIASGKLDTNKLSQAQVAYLQSCDGAVKRAGAKFQTLRSASRLRNEIKSIYKGIQS